jgi:hypothetical protein
VAKEIAELNQIRLDEDLPIATLAQAIGIDQSTLHRLLFVPGREPWDRTLHKIRRYLAERKAAEERKAARKAKGRAA